MSRAFYSPVKPGGPSKEEGKTGHKTAERALRTSHTNNKSMSTLNKSVVQEQRKRRNYFDEMSCGTKSKLGELLLTVAEEELLIERQRQAVASLREFEPYSVFTRIDRDRKEYISSRDIVGFLR